MNRILKCFCAGVLTMLISQTVMGQKTDTQETILCIKEKSKEMFVKLGRSIGEGDIDNVHLNEIVKHKTIGYNTNGIYSISDYSSHRARYILLKKGGKIKILDFNKISESLKDAINFLNEIGSSEIDTINYLHAITAIMNSNLSAIEDKKIYFQNDWIKCADDIDDNPE